ncbi:MAG: 2-polyprenylphenol 6-hydroxylase [Hyphomicrobium sp.]|nr:2-polyprenylphenol 6-hydroxylase [Hyphomicrobium sp.]
MAGAVVNLVRLAKAGIVLAGHSVRFVPKGQPVPWPMRLAQWATLPIRLVAAPFNWGQPKDERISRALASLGPSYIKLGQFLATRADIIGPELQADLSRLQDRLPPFSMSEARRVVEQSLGGRLEDHFVEFGPPVAAASIAQVHKAIVEEKGERRAVAVKVLRPGIGRRFQRDLDSFAFAARQIERYHPPARRLRPLAVVENLARTTKLEMDLRLEAAAMSEMADNIRPGEGIRIPAVDWRRTAERVLTTEWIDGIPMNDKAALVAAGHDLHALGLNVIRAFLTHAMRQGFFHADMHQGNLFVEKSGTIVAVDFGIMGRLGPAERRFLAEILHGLITRDYRRAAEVHFWAGYVPPHHPVETFAQALRAIGEPIHGKTAEEISMADLLGQLFAYTEVFDMQTRPELILLQKSMVIVEGVARGLNPALNLWVAAEPIAKDWVESNLGAAGRLREAGEGASSLARVVGSLPAFVTEAEKGMRALGRMASDGVTLSPEGLEGLAKSRGFTDRVKAAALVVSAAALAAIAMGYLGLMPR